MYSNFTATPASEGRSDTSAGALRMVILQQKEPVNALGIMFTVKHLFPQVVRHSERILNYLVCIDFLIDLEIMRLKYTLQTLCQGQRVCSIAFRFVDVNVTKNNNSFNKHVFFVRENREW